MAGKSPQPSHEPPFHAEGTLRPSRRPRSERRKGSWLGEAMALNSPRSRGTLSPQKKGEGKDNKTQKYLRQLACHTYDGINWRTNVELVSIAGPSAKGFDKVIWDSPSSC